MKKLLLPLLGLSTSMALLTACGSTKLLGDKAPPDETQVIDGPGLVLPPDFDLRPPREAQDYETILRSQKNAEAQTLITGVSTTAVTGVSSSVVPASDEWLLKQAGGTAQPGIREKLSGEVKTDKASAAKKRKEEQGILKRWFSKNTDEETDDE